MPTHLPDLNAALSGPISKGDQEANLRAFEVARAALLAEGRYANVFSPTRNPRARAAAEESAALIRIREDYRRGELYLEAVRWYSERLLRADVLFVLSGWEKSHGARGEAWLAHQCGIEVRAWSVVPGLRYLIDPGLRLMSAKDIDDVHRDGFSWAV